MSNRLEAAIEACTSLAEAQEIIRDVRKTAVTAQNAHGADHRISKMLSDRYWNAVDLMTLKFA